MNAIKIVKLFNQELFQEKKLDNIRKKELVNIRHINATLVFHMLFGQISYIFVTVVAFGALIGFNRLDLS